MYIYIVIVARDVCRERGGGGGKRRRRRRPPHYESCARMHALLPRGSIRIIDEVLKRCLANV